MQAMGYSADDYDEFYGLGDYSDSQRLMADGSQEEAGCASVFGTSDWTYRLLYWALVCSLLGAMATQPRLVGGNATSHIGST